MKRLLCAALLAASGAMADEQIPGGSFYFGPGVQVGSARGFTTSLSLRGQVETSRWVFGGELRGGVTGNSY